MIVDEMSQAREFTRQHQAVVLPLPSTDLLYELVGDLFEDVLHSFSVILNKDRPCWHSDESVLNSYVREECHGRKERRELNSWTTLITVPHDDGHQWRKYGKSRSRIQNFHEQGCLATKTVQQEDGHDDPPKFTVTFGKQHSCKIVETGSPFVMDSSSNYQESSAIILESNCGQKQKEDHSLSSSTMEEFSVVEMLLSGPAFPHCKITLTDDTSGFGYRLDYN